jgi:hypothetical protein
LSVPAPELYTSEFVLAVGGGTEGSAVEYKGIKYEIKIAPGPNEWVWTVHLPEAQRQGAVKGPRTRAEIAAQTAIDAFCREHPADCLPPTPDNPASQLGN